MKRLYARISRKCQANVPTDEQNAISQSSLRRPSFPDQLNSRRSCVQQTALRQNTLPAPSPFLREPTSIARSSGRGSFRFEAPSGRPFTFLAIQRPLPVSPSTGESIGNPRRGDRENVREEAFAFLLRCCDAVFGVPRQRFA